MVQLTVRPPGKAAFAIEVGSARLTLGRSVRNEVYLDDPFSSRLHAEIRVEGGQVLLHDLGSANGTFVNSRRVQGEVVVGPGDRIQIGETWLDLEIGGEATRHPEEDTSSRQSWPAVEELPPISSSMRTVLETVHQAAGSSPELEAQERRQDLFAVMSQVGIALLSPWALDEVLDEILRLIFEGVPADRSLLLLKGKDDRQLACRVSRCRDGALDPANVQISAAIQREVIDKGQSVLTSDALEDERFRDQQSIVVSGIRSVMAVPISVQSQVLGMIYVDSPVSANIFTEDDLRLLTTIATVAAIKIENARLVEHRIESERLHQQLASARDIQRRLLPSSPPELDGYEVTGFSFPCFEVGGDYYDFVSREDKHLLLALGDVSGKGMDAALLMSSLHAAMRAQAEAGGTVGEVVGRVNRYLYDTMPNNKFTTLFAASLDLQSHRLTFTNAGQCPPLLVREDGEVLELEKGGYPLAIARDTCYPETTVTLRPGDVLFCRSDGLDEAVDEAGEEFGEERLVECLRSHRDLGVVELWDRIDETLDAFTGEASPVDDMTAVLLKRTG